MEEDLKVSIVLPKYPVHIPEGKHVYYLAGPIRGTDDWQADAIRILAELDPSCYVVCPCRYDETHPLWKYRTLSVSEVEPFARQTLWEREYMVIAAQRGCLIFWIPCESKTNPRPKEAGPYARDTYGEFGRYPNKILSLGSYPRMAVGAAPDLPEGFGMEQIKTNLSEDFGFQYPIENSLEALLQKAVTLANS